MKEWINRRGRIYWYDQYTLNEQETAFAKYDPDRIVREMVDVGADIVALYATNQYGIAYYPSKVVPQHPNLKGRDYFGEVLAGLRRHGKKVIAYTNWLTSTHPEWWGHPIYEKEPISTDAPLASWADPSDPDRRVYDFRGGWWKSSCLNSPRRDQIIAVTKEIVERYKPDGFHLDMLAGGSICICPYCRPTLERICGTSELTEEIVKAHWREFFDWRSESCASLFAEIYPILREHDVIAAHNAFAPVVLLPLWGRSEKELPYLDVFLSECFDEFCVENTDLNFNSINVRWQHAVGKPSWVLVTSHKCTHYSHWPIPEAMWKIHAAASKANGCKVFGPCGVGAYPDTTTPKQLYANIKTGLDFYMDDADLDEGAESAARTALVFSWGTRNYSESDGWNMPWCETFQGMARLMMEEHLPYDILVAENITAESVSKYDLLVFSNISHLSDGVCDTIREYVRQGGRILATGETSIYTERGDKRPDFALGDVFGAKWTGSENGDFAIEMSVEPGPASGAFQNVTAAGEIIVRQFRVDPAGPVSGGTKDSLPMAVTEWPVAVRHNFGKGQSFYAAFDIGRYFQIHGDWHIGKIMAEWLDMMMPEKQIVVKAPRTVEVTLWEQPALDRTIIHIANRTVPWTVPTRARQITEVTPVHDIELSIAAPHGNPKITCRHCEADFSIDSGRLIIRIPVVEEYAAVLVE